MAQKSGLIAVMGLCKEYTLHMSNIHFICQIYNLYVKYTLYMSNNDRPDVRKTNKLQNTLKLIITKVLKLELKPTKLGGHYHKIDSENRAVKTYPPTFNFVGICVLRLGGGGGT